VIVVNDPLSILIHTPIIIHVNVLWYVVPNVSNQEERIGNEVVTFAKRMKRVNLFINVKMMDADDMLMVTI